MTKYIAKKPDKNGFIQYSDVENDTWKTLYHRQMKVIENRACSEFISGLEKLNMSGDRIPQLPEVNAALQALTGWSVMKVEAAISANDFFNLLANKGFPAATFIRTPAELDYLQEPDIFHELFGHCPMITHQAFADFLQEYGQFALAAPKEHHKLLFRLFWFTVEFGLIETPNGFRCYGGGILSSKEETIYAIDSEVPIRKPFNLAEVLRTPYRVDQIQGVYFLINDYEELFALLKLELNDAIAHARSLSEFELVEINKGASKDEWITC